MLCPFHDLRDYNDIERWRLCSNNGHSKNLRKHRQRKGNHPRIKEISKHAEKILLTTKQKSHHNRLILFINYVKTILAVIRYRDPLKTGRHTRSIVVLLYWFLTTKLTRIFLQEIVAGYFYSSTTRETHWVSLVVDTNKTTIKQQIFRQLRKGSRKAE